MISTSYKRVALSFWRKISFHFYNVLHETEKQFIKIDKNASLDLSAYLHCIMP